MSACRAEAIVIGASAGALDALTAILPSLPTGYPLPVIIVVHLPPDRPSILAELLDAKSKVTVKEAEDKEVLLKGVVYIRLPITIFWLKRAANCRCQATNQSTSQGPRSTSYSRRPQTHTAAGSSQSS